MVGFVCANNRTVWNVHANEKFIWQMILLSREEKTKWNYRKTASCILRKYLHRERKIIPIRRMCSPDWREGVMQPHRHILAAVVGSIWCGPHYEYGELTTNAAVSIQWLGSTITSADVIDRLMVAIIDSIRLHMIHHWSRWPELHSMPTMLAMTMKTMLMIATNWWHYLLRLLQLTTIDWYQSKQFDRWPTATIDYCLL